MRRTLAPHLVGRRIACCRIDDPRLTRPAPPEPIAARLVGQRIAGLGRQGKYLIVELGGGARLAVHLRMTGQLVHRDRDDVASDPHRRAHCLLDDGTLLTYRDVRRFGTWQWFDDAAALDAFLLPRVGLDASSGDFTGAYLRAQLAGRRLPIRSALLDQRICAGSGNIYTCEALWEAGIDPAGAAQSLSAADCERLASALRGILRTAIKRGGSSISDYRDGNGDPGRMQDDLQVYGRGGAPCLRCAAPLRQGPIGGRGTVWCATCQPPTSAP